MKKEYNIDLNIVFICPMAMIWYLISCGELGKLDIRMPPFPGVRVIA